MPNSPKPPGQPDMDSKATIRQPLGEPTFVGDFIREIAGGLDMGIVILADKSGIGRRYIWRIISGEVTLSVKNAIRLQNGSGVDAVTLLNIQSTYQVWQYSAKGYE